MWYISGIFKHIVYLIWHASLRQNRCIVSIPHSSTFISCLSAPCRVSTPHLTHTLLLVFQTAQGGSAKFITTGLTLLLEFIYRILLLLISLTFSSRH